MPGGIIQLEVKGKMDTVLTGQPEMTFFKTVYKRHTKFSMETIEIYAELAQNELLQSSSVLFKIRIPRQGDLLNRIYICLDLPDIYSDELTQFKWIEDLGYNMIDKVRVLVGNATIQEYTGNWLHVRNLLYTSDEKKPDINKMVGNLPELYNPKYANPDSIVYPASTLPLSSSLISNTFNDNSEHFNFNAPSIRGRRLWIPIPFWFCELLSNSLPLIALQYHEVEIQVLIRPMNDLYTICKIPFISNMLSVSWSPNPIEYIAAGYYDTFIRLWSFDPNNVNNTDVISILRAHPAAVNSLEWCPNFEYETEPSNIYTFDKILFSGSADGTILLSYISTNNNNTDLRILEIYEPFNIDAGGFSGNVFTDLNVSSQNQNRYLLSVLNKNTNYNAYWQIRDLRPGRTSNTIYSIIGTNILVSCCSWLTYSSTYSMMDIPSNPNFFAVGTAEGIIYIYQFIINMDNTMDYIPYYIIGLQEYGIRSIDWQRIQLSPAIDFIASGGDNKYLYIWKDIFNVPNPIPDINNLSLFIQYSNNFSNELFSSILQYNNTSGGVNNNIIFSNYGGFNGVNTLFPITYETTGLDFDGDNKTFVIGNNGTDTVISKFFLNTQLSSVTLTGILCNNISINNITPDHISIYNTNINSQIYRTIDSFISPIGAPIYTCPVGFSLLNAFEQNESIYIIEYNSNTINIKKYDTNTLIITLIQTYSTIGTYSNIFSNISYSNDYENTIIIITFNDTNISQSYIQIFINDNPYFNSSNPPTILDVFNQYSTLLDPSKNWYIDCSCCSTVNNNSIILINLFLRASDNLLNFFGKIQINNNIPNITITNSYLTDFFALNPNSLTSMECTNDGKYIIAGGNLDIIMKSNDYGQNWFKLPYLYNNVRSNLSDNHTKAITSLKWNNDTTQILTGSLDTTAKFWTFSPTLPITPNLVQTLNNSSSEIYSVDFNYASNYIATGSWNSKLNIYKIN